MGSAQSRRAQYVLQHGTLPLTGDITRLIDILALPPDQASTLRAELAMRAGTLAQALAVTDHSPNVQFENVWPAIRRGFEEVLALNFQQATISAAEMRRAAELIRLQYANTEWINYK